jgi:hypothetical protein
LAGFRDLPVARAMLGHRLASFGPGVVAAELEPLFAGAAAGQVRERAAIPALGSWVAHTLSAGEGSRLVAIGVAGHGLPYVRAVFGADDARASLPALGRLPEGTLAVYANISGRRPRRYAGQSADDWRRHCAMLARHPGARAWVTRGMREPAARHHDPVFVARLLDQDWLQAQHVLQVAARRPSVPAIALAVATRDKWWSVRAVRDALAENPYTPGILARVLDFARS